MNLYLPAEMKHWIAAFRLKTLPLALGAIVLGSTVYLDNFQWKIFGLAALTAIFLQVLSNLANDYGDFKKGTDKHRTDRQLAGGNITPQSMLVAIVLLTILALTAGIYQLNVSFGDNANYWFKFLGIGIASIIAAITYTVGQKAYGYNGLGDLFVFIFFGLVGVIGTSFLFCQELITGAAFVAIAYGCLCVGVLNVNNIRDLDKDILTNKITLASKFGKVGAETYQTLLLTVSFCAFVGHHILADIWSLAPLAVLVLGLVHIRKLKKAKQTTDYNAQLKLLSIGSLIVALFFIIKIG